MKTTLNIRDDLLAEAKALAVREHSTLARVVEEGLALRLAAETPTSPPKDHTPLPALPVSTRRGGLLPGVDGCSNRSMLEATERLDGLQK